MNHGFGKSCALFMSLAVLSATGITLFAAPVAAATVCQSPCSMGTTAVGLRGGSSDFVDFPYDLGVQFHSNADGFITAISFWDAPSETGTHTVALWDNAAPGSPLASTIVGNNPGTVVNTALSPPVHITANHEYIASYTENHSYGYNGGGGLPTGGTVVADAGAFNTSQSGAPQSNFGIDYGIDVTFQNAPAAPTITSVNGANLTSASVAFSDPPVSGTTYTATCTSIYGGTPQTGSGFSSPIIVGGLGNKSTGTWQFTDAITCTVTATDTAGSATSAPSALTLLGTAGPGNCTSPPLVAPTHPTSAPGNGSATVSWFNQQPPNPCVDGYVITPSSGSPVLTFGAGTTSVVKGLTNGTSYTFTIAADNGATVGPSSTATVSITVGAPAATSALKVTHVANGAVEVTFKAPKNNGAPITRYTATCGTKSASGRTGPLTVTGLTKGKTYTCTVKATNSRGTGPPSTPSAAVKA